MIHKRHFLKLTAGLGLLGMSSAPAIANILQDENGSAGQGDALRKLRFPPLIAGDEREARLNKVRQLMRENDIKALIVEPGSSMVYFSGMRWWRSERLTALIIPADGPVGVVTPYFEAPSVKESLGVDAEIRTWHEHESPFALVAGYLADQGIVSGKVAMEQTTRFFVNDGIQAQMPDADIVSGAGVVNGCRMFKSQTELALMQAANDVTMAAYHHVHSKIEIGMEPGDVSSLMADATRKLGARHGFSLVLLGEASAYPHGSGQPQKVEEGSIILMDCGAEVHDYESDISRTFIIGEPSKKQREVWETVKRGQEIVMESAQLGAKAGSVDDAVRGYYEFLGYGPDYKTPGLSHRTGHGIGMDGHEPINLVRGEDTKLQPGMCFSNEPGLYIFGEFGVRLEDCFYMTETGPQLFTPLQTSIESPV